MLIAPYFFNYSIWFQLGSELSLLLTVLIILAQSEEEIIKISKYIT